MEKKMGSAQLFKILKFHAQLARVIEQIYELCSYDPAEVNPDNDPVIAGILANFNRTIVEASATVDQVTGESHE